MQSTSTMDKKCMSAPHWLEPLLSITTFFSACEVHPEVSRNECNLFCLDCGEKPVCLYCIAASHKDHRVLQVRRSSYHDVVKVNEIQKYLDITGIQTYMINGAKVAFLNKRAPNELKANKSGKVGLKSKLSQCDTCQRKLIDPSCFCSLGCKLAWIKKSERGSFDSSTNKDEEMRMPEEMPRRLPSNAEEEESREVINVESYKSEFSPFTLPNPQAGSMRKRRRKGIPHRAPFF